MNQNYVTVTQLTKYIKYIIDNDIHLSNIYEYILNLGLFLSSFNNFWIILGSSLLSAFQNP